MAKELTQEARLGKQCYDKARDQFGSGWNLMTRAIKEMAVSAQVLNVLYAQTETGANTVEWVKEIRTIAFSFLPPV